MKLVLSLSQLPTAGMQEGWRKNEGKWPITAEELPDVSGISANKWRIEKNQAKPQVP